MYVNHEILENSIDKWTENLGNPIGNEMKIEITGNKMKIRHLCYILLAYVTIKYWKRCYQALKSMFYNKLERNTKNVLEKN